MLRVAIEKAGYTGKIKIGMDVAASEFCKKQEGAFKYDLDFKNPNSDPAHWVRIRFSRAFFIMTFMVQNITKHTAPSGIQCQKL